MSVTSGTKRKEGGIGETVRVIIHALIIALVIRTFFFQPFNIPSGSMKDTLLVGDYLFVSKYTYGYSKYSFPLSPSIFSGRIPGDWLPERGDVVVFRLPKDPSTDYIKRVIGLPGDKVCGVGGKVVVNGVAISEPYLVQKTAPFPCQKVPSDRYFVLGDNRDNSLDSRFTLGTVPRDAIIGKAFFIVWPPSRWNTL